MNAEQTWWKIGELAKRTGITVRTLHHYDQIGLLVPSVHSDAGHRLYSATDIARLQQILTLKQLGFHLEEAKALLDNPDFLPEEAVRLQLQRVNEHIRIHDDLRSRLEGLYAMLQTQQVVTVEQLIQLIEVMKMTEQYFTPEQQAKIKQQRELLGAEKIKTVENEWPILIAKVRAEMEQGTPPESPAAQALGKRWNELVELFTGGDPSISTSLGRFYGDNPDKAAEYGIDKDIWLYIQQAMDHI